MGQQEMEKMERLLIMAIEAAEQSQMERRSVREYFVNDQMYEAELAQRKSDKYYGYAQGICRALTELNYQHKDIEKLFELLK